MTRAKNAMPSPPSPITMIFSRGCCATALPSVKKLLPLKYRPVMKSVSPADQ